MGKLNGVGTKLTGVFKSLGGVLLNAFASAALSWGITKLGDGLKWIYDNWLTDNAKIEKELKKIEKANKNLEKSISDLTESESELSNVESEISRINDEISSIQSKGKLELTDEGDIDRLSRQNSLLQTQKRILENNIKLQKDSMAFSAKNVLDTGYTGKTYEVSDKSTVVSTGDENYSYKDWAKYYETAFITQSYNGYLKALSSGDDAKQKLYKEAVDKNSAEITQYISSLYEILQSFQDSEGNIINGYEDLYEEYTEIIANLQSLIDPNNFNQFVLDWSKDEKLNYDFEKGFNDVLEDMYGMEDFDFNELKSMNEEFFDKLSEQGISDATITSILNYKRSIYESVLKSINGAYNFDLSKIGTTSIGESTTPSALDIENSKLTEWGLENYKDQIDSGILHKFGNVDMDKRVIITWSDELKKTYQEELDSWDYNPEIGGIDTVFGGSAGFNWDNEEHQIAFTPIMQTEDGAVFLGRDEVYDYIDSVISKAGEDGIITADEILKIDAVDTGKKFGADFGRGLIAGIDSYGGISAEDIGSLMHFSGKYGAWNLAKQEPSIENDPAYQYMEESKEAYDILTNYVTSHPLESGLEKLPEQYEHLKELMGDNWKNEFINEFTPEERQLALKIEVTDEDYDYDSLKKKLQAKISPIEIDVMPKASDAVDSMADMKSAVASLSDLYNQTVLQAASENADSFGTFAADPATLNSIESAFDKFIKKESDAGNDVTELNSALEDFQRISVESFGEDDYAEQMQSAINNLITAYVDQTDVIQNLTEENKEWSIEQLKAMGITNAEEVVLTRLGVAAKKTGKNLANLSNVIKKNRSILEAGSKAGKKYTEAIEEILPEVRKLLTMYDKDGKEIVPELDASFVIANLNDLYAAIDGDVEALARLRVEAAKGFVVNAELQTDDFWKQCATLAADIMSLDQSSFTVDGYLDNTDILNKLAATNQAFQGSLEEWADYINTITGGVITADVQYEELTVEQAVQQGQVKNTMGMPSSIQSVAKIKIPKVVGYKYNAGAGANYTAPSGGNTTGSGGGGGGGGSEPTQPKEESEETFDWIEVAIQRIEEEISRLDKVVGNTYETWGERNKARTKEIKELEKEYEALGIAADEYFRNAEEVKVNGGKGLNDDDYGENDELVKAHDQELLDEANRLWATGEYQRKVLEGQMTGDDIEKIANPFLADTVKEYQEIIQKGIDTRDKEYDRFIEMGNQYKGAFDDAKEEYSELIQYITDQADVIDEKINRTEKRGYFVSESYYEDLKTLESQRYAKLNAEYEDLIKKRDEAVASGKIKEGSEAWRTYCHYTIVICI